MLTNQWFKQELEASKTRNNLNSVREKTSVTMDSLVWVRGCEKQKAKCCADSAGEEEQLVKLQVEMFHLLKACSKAEWQLGHWFKKEQAIVLEPSQCDC